MGADKRRERSDSRTCDAGRGQVSGAIEAMRVSDRSEHSKRRQFAAKCCVSQQAGELLLYARSWNGSCRDVDLLLVFRGYVASEDRGEATLMDGGKEGQPRMRLARNVFYRPFKEVLWMCQRQGPSPRRCVS